MTIIVYHYDTLLLILKQVGFLWNRTVVVVVDKLSSTSVDFIRSERQPVCLQQLFCSRENQLASRFIQQNGKSTSNLLLMFTLI